MATDRALALGIALFAGVCATPLAHADGFIFQVSPDGQLIDIASTGGGLRSLEIGNGEQNAAPTDRLFLFAAARPGEADNPSSSVPAANTRPVPASPELLQAIETTALRYGGHGALRQAGLSVSDWALFYRANIEVESAYNPAALSPVGAIGLGQLMPDTARDLGVDPHDIAQNLDGSARYLLMMLEQFGDPALALAAYNAGPQAVTRHGGIPPFQETQGHVARVTAVFQRLRGELS